jgi:hypothetical protein
MNWTEGTLDASGSGCENFIISFESVNTLQPYSFVMAVWSKLILEKMFISVMFGN